MSDVAIPSMSDITVPEVDRRAIHDEITQLSGHTIKVILDTLRTHPMMSGMLGPEFQAEATRISDRLGTLLSDVVENYPQD